MKTRRKLTPGQPGTKRWVEKYGEALVCVRYRYDLKRKRKMTTVELIVEQRPWEPDGHKIPANKIIGVRIDYEETYLRKLVKAAGGRWNRNKKLWELPYAEVLQLGLSDRILRNRLKMSNIRQRDTPDHDV